MFRSKYFKDLNIRYSLIKTFATFLLLSYTKIFNISRALLSYTEVWNITGDSVKMVPIIDASISYLSATHIPYVVIAMFMIVTFNLLPLFLLLLYPMKCFQLFLGKFPGVNWHPLRAFMDIFQGCYKNGTDGTRDCRYFAAFNFIVRLVALFLTDDPTDFFLRSGIIIIIFIAMIAILRPYQRNIFNIWEIFSYSMFLTVTLWLLYVVLGKAQSLTLIYTAYFILFSYLIFVYLAKILKTLFPRCYNTCVNTAIKRLTEKNLFPCCRYQQEATMADLMEKGDVNLLSSHEDSPDRVNNPQDYEPLLNRSRQSSIVSTSYGIN